MLAYVGGVAKVAMGEVKGWGKESVMDSAVRREGFCMTGSGDKKKLSTSIDEELVEKSDRTVLKAMKLISYEADWTMMSAEKVVVDHGF